MRQSTSLIVLLGLTLTPGYRLAGRQPLTIRFHNKVGSQPLRLSATTYLNRFGEPFVVEQCKYYISDIRVTDPDGKEEPLMREPHLVDAADPASLTLRLKGTTAVLRAIRFIIGVDSLANTGGVTTGDLDPMLGMFWTWNTGYIYARLEGQSDSAHAPAHRFTWDIGGYRGNANAVRQVTLAIPGDHPEDEPLDIDADLLKWFDGRYPIHLAQSPICHQPGALAMQLADNCSTLFSITP